MLTRFFSARLPVIALLVTIGFLSALERAGAQGAAANAAKTAREDFDIRDGSALVVNGTHGKTRANYQRAQMQGAHAASVAALVQGMAGARDALRTTLPTLQVTNSRFDTSPEIVGTTTANVFLTPGTAAPHEETLRGFLSTQAALYGLSLGEAAALVKFSDYQNPDGNLFWVGLRQELNGLPVFQGEILAAFTKDGALARTTGNLAMGLDPAALSLFPALRPEQAVVHAAVAVGRKVDATQLKVGASEANGRISHVTGGPFGRETKTELLCFPLEPGVATLAYGVVLWGASRAYYVLVDANDGTLLFRKCLTAEQSQSVTYHIYNDDSPAPLSPSTVLPGEGTQAPGISRVAIAAVSELPAYDNLGWIADSASGATVTTTGNNCDAGLDLVAPSGIDAGTRPTTTTRSFNYAYKPAPIGTTDPTDPAYCNGAVTNAFFWANRYHDRIYQLGFTEAARNFQTNNFGRGGAAADAVSAQIHDYSGLDNANFSTPPDGSPGIMQMYLFNDSTPGRDGALDVEVLLHELTHGVSNRLHANASGLATNHSKGLGEGWSDFFARCLLSSSDEDVDGVYPSASYISYAPEIDTDNHYYGVRRFPYAVISALGPNGKPHNPETFADIDEVQEELNDGAFPPNPRVGGGAREPHSIGEVWCSMLLEVRARLIKRRGYAIGNARAMQLVVDAMKLDPASPDMVQARDSILAADDAGYGGVDRLDILSGFAARGLGIGADYNSGSPLEVFSVYLRFGDIAVSDALGNNNGVFEPGEDLLITVPVQNIGFQSENATVQIGNYTAPYFVFPNGGMTTKIIPYHLPAATLPGSRVVIPVVCTGIYGSFSKTVTLDIGAPIYGFTQTFDGSNNSLPAGWTTTTATNGSGGVYGTPWTVVANNPIDVANCVYSPDLAGNNIDGGEADLYSPPVAIPASGAPRLSFVHRYGTERQGYFIQAGGVLEISIAGGGYVDILTAGGSFEQNGYIQKIESFHGNPLGGRMAFGGTSPGSLTTVVNLPAAALGQSAQFRWRLVFDRFQFHGPNGWYIDTVRLITGYAVAPVDADGDGIPNGWESAHGLNPADPTDGAKDLDGDGMSNLLEYLAGTDPQNARSVLRITSIAYAAQAGTTVTFDSINGKTYAVDYCDDLVAGVWTRFMSGLAGTGSPLQITDVGTGKRAKRFYRVRVTGQ